MLVLLLLPVDACKPTTTAVPCSCQAQPLCWNLAWTKEQTRMFSPSHVHPDKAQLAYPSPLFSPRLLYPTPTSVFRLHLPCLHSSRIAFPTLAPTSVRRSFVSPRCFPPWVRRRIGGSSLSPASPLPPPPHWSPPTHRLWHRALFGSNHCALTNRQIAGLFGSHHVILIFV